jgi:hypothetical protein
VWDRFQNWNKDINIFLGGGGYEKRAEKGYVKQTSKEEKNDKRES